MTTHHKIYFSNSQNMKEVKDESVHLIVTSPPYPMIEMWDEVFGQSNPLILDALNNHDGVKACNLMHEELNKTWNEVDRVLVPGGIICINIGDAARRIGSNFQLFSNHSKIILFFEEKGYNVLPGIIWQKLSNKPNTFMGSGMLPVNAYVTLGHEYILIFRKGDKRKFKSRERDRSAFFWEERNQWFSGIWNGINGAKQKFNGPREVSAAYPIDIPHRLINMFSKKNDVVLDPFLGLGTTTMAAIMNERNSIGYEIVKELEDNIYNNIMTYDYNHYIDKRFTQHISFAQTKDMKYTHNNYDFNVVTKQEQNIEINSIQTIKQNNNNFNVVYASRFF